MKTPPDRSGITFQVGAQLEARDRHKNWYSATIERIDYERERVLVHYKQWSRRHNEWFQWSSPYLRPLERVSLRRRGLNPPPSQPMFVSGARVLACWTDCRFYPAKILRVNKDDSYTVRFYDGVVRTVKPTKIKSFQNKARCEKTAVGSEGWEEGESEEEEDGGKQEGEIEAAKEEEMVEKEASELKDAPEDKERDEKRRPRPSTSHSYTKSKTGSGRSSGDHDMSSPADSALPTAENPAHINRGKQEPEPGPSPQHGHPATSGAPYNVLLERQAHLPTTHKFSREPLYRVIKNQPPPILSIELDHNPFKCPSAGCSKSFRKASLLHYHIKYYHSADGAAGAAGEQDATRRRRPPSEGADPTERTAEGQSGGGGGGGGGCCQRDEREHSGLATDVKKSEGKNRKKFLRVKLKKKKKKKKRKKSHTGYCSSDDEKSDQHPVTVTHTNTHTPADEGSDWSTLTAESGEDTPSWQVAMEMEDCEVVRCVCEVDEENDFMIQCESCLCWQHGTCMGLYEDNVPHNYICYHCRHTAGSRQAQRVLAEPDWLVSGHMFGLSCLKENYSEVNSSKISHTGRLLAHTHGLQEALQGLQLKISLLHAPSHPDLQMWRLPWQQEEGPSLAFSLRGEPSVCYVSSEHSYQKPGASWEKAEDEATPRARHSDARRRCSEEPQFDVAVQEASHDADAHAAMQVESGAESQRGASEVKCRLNLLNHVETLQREICNRMELMERELDVMESWLDHSGELEPPDPLSRLPQLKQRIRQLLCDLCIVRRLSVYR